MVLPMKFALYYVQDRDLIDINVHEERIQLRVSDEELKKRQEAPLRRPGHPATAVMTAYRGLGAGIGAVWL